MKKGLIVASSLLIMSASSIAGNVGCGLGNMVIKNQNSTLMQILAVTTNGTSGNQTFGITSGSLGCSKPSKFVSNKVESFVADNMDSLALDISNGQGATLNTLASLLKVKDSVAFGKKLQSNFSSIYSSSKVTSAQVIDSVIVLGS